MRKSEMRVLIAKDVIKWLKAGKFKATNGVFVRLVGKKLDDYSPNNDDAKAALDLRNRKTCHVCQRGALLLAAIDRFDACGLSPVHYYIEDKLNVMAGWDANNTSNGVGGLSRWFRESQYREMEEAFEFYDSEWYESYHNATARMDAICRNLIAHEGVFVASDIPRPRKNPYWTKKR